MRVKIGNAWYSTDHHSICIQMTEEEHEQIKNMTKEGSPDLKYAVFSDSDTRSPEHKLQWMKKETLA